MDEIALVKMAQKGDLDSFNRLVLHYQDSVYNLACHILSDHDLASDATQSTFISAYRNITQFRGGSFKAWLMRMVSNNCLDELRRQKRHPSIALEPTNPENDEEFETPAWLKDDSPSPENILETKELEQGIQHCLDQLPNEFKIIVLLVDVEGLDYLQASQSINKPLGTVKSRLARARFKLQECLRGFRELLPVGIRLEEEENI
jgi:RNA polymerase sigma-70 factor, ECF subfamily